MKTPATSLARTLMGAGAMGSLNRTASGWTSPLHRIGLRPPRFHGERPWALVWCCADLCQSPEALTGADPAELLVLQGASTFPHADALADAVWSVRVHELSHVFVVAHARCRLLRDVLGSDGLAPALALQLDRLGLFAGYDPDDVSRALACDSSRALRMQLAQHGAQAQVVPLFVDAHAQLSKLDDIGPRSARFA